jgi:hypothetical protein
MSQKQSDAAQLKKEDEKKKEKSTVKWNIIECDGSFKKSDSKVPVYNHSELRKSRRTCYFGPQPKAGAPGTVCNTPFSQHKNFIIKIRVSQS